MCIYVCVIAKDIELILEKEGAAECIKNGIAYVLRIVEGDSSHYIYTRKDCAFL